MQEWSEAELRQKLSARQYEVLSLVARHLSSKEIGARLGLSYKTIDNHVADLMVRLGVTSRADAARIFLDSSKTRERLPSTSQPLDSPALSDASTDRPERAPRRTSLLRLPPVGGTRHDMTHAQRLVAMGQIALVSVAGLGAIVTVMVGILNLLGR
ncbi:helix-turn-helix transcriptional regulator [Novosphingobium resinovorum]|uniref:helix-turn-helix domain-containing protein n=1 Tax=Novosphingobium resinovorum TaxID=158500 RepID=UPI002ED059AE|nr:helix-turn-helix transcriptional regulator [Novosphingobium resinovorum]